MATISASRCCLTVWAAVPVAFEGHADCGPGPGVYLVLVCRAVGQSYITHDVHLRPTPRRCGFRSCAWRLAVRPLRWRFWMPSCDAGAGVNGSLPARARWPNKENNMDMMAALVLIIALFAVLGAGMWIGLGLTGRGPHRHGAVHQPPRGRHSTMLTIWGASSA